MMDEFKILPQWGWNDHWAHLYSRADAEDSAPARVMARYQDIFRIITEYGEINAEVSGKLRLSSNSPNEFPVPGDWVRVHLNDTKDHAHILSIIERTNKFSRKAPGDVLGDVLEEQLLASNLDHIFIFNALDRDFNPRRVERFLALSHACGAAPYIILSKEDICTDLKAKKALMQNVAGDTPILSISTLANKGITQLRKILLPGTTTAFLGASGVGKSTLLNLLMGEDLQEVKTVRKDSRGRHTTRTRELFLLQSGAIILDTPGMRELALWEADQGLEDTFQDVEALFSQCKFRDCTHQVEPGCAVMAAVESGALSQKRYDSYIKLRNELNFTNAKSRGYSDDPKQIRQKQIAKFRRQVHKKK